MLNLQTRNLGTVAVLKLQGQMIIGETETLRDVVQSLPQTSSVILDLSRVSIVDAHGLGVMLQLREQTHAKGACFQLVNIGRQLREIMQLTRLDSVFMDHAQQTPLAA
jgi:anti-sigma B factor antagonist